MSSATLEVDVFAPSDEVTAAVLQVRLGAEHQGLSVREYLVGLLAHLWGGGARLRDDPAGWHAPVLEAVAAAGLVPSWRPGGGPVRGEAALDAGLLVHAAIRSLGRGDVVPGG